MPIGEGRSFTSPPQPQGRGQIQQRPGINRGRDPFDPTGTQRDPFDPGGGQAPFDPFGRGADEPTIFRQGAGGRTGEDNPVTLKLKPGQVLQLGGGALDQMAVSLLGTEHPGFKELAKLMEKRGFKASVKKMPNKKQRVVFIKKAVSTPPL